MANEKLIFDGSLDFLGGQDASKVPDRIAANAYYAGVNTSTEKGVIRPRFGLEKLQITLPEGGITLPTTQVRTYKDIFSSGKFQALIPYTIGQDFYFIIVISGIIFLVNQRTLTATVLTLPDKSMINEMASRVNWASAGRFIVIFDYPAFPIIIDGITARRADPTKNEVPISVLGAYNQNRLFIANAGDDFTAGDPVGSIATPDAPVTFNEILTPASPFFGQIFQLPTTNNSEFITAMTFLPTADTSTGIGPLLIATQNSIFSFNTQNPRALWETQQFGSMFVYNAGIAGPRAFTHVNSDMFYMSSDGQVRSLSMSRDEQRKWSKVPISREVSNWIKFWDRSLIQYTNLFYFKNKIFVSVNPHRVQAITNGNLPTVDYASAGFVVLETDNLATLGQTSPPTWAGLWTGVNPMDVVTNNERCFIISKDQNFVNTLYEMRPDLTYDVSGGDIRYIRSRVYTREYDFKDPFALKTLHSLDVNLENLKGAFKMDVKFKSAQASKFYDWRTFAHNSPWRTCFVPQGNQVKGFLGQQIRDLNLGWPIDNEACSEVDKTLFRTFKKVQLQFTFIGKYWEMHEFKIKAEALTQNETQANCETLPTVDVIAECNDDWMVGPFQSCEENKI